MSVIKVTLVDGELDVAKHLLMNHCVLIRNDLEDDDSKTETNLQVGGAKIYATKKNAEILVRYCEAAEKIGAPDIQRPIHKFVSSVQQTLPSQFCSLIQDLTSDELAQLILFSNYIDCQGLLDISAAALHFKVKELEEADKVRALFNLEDDKHDDEALKQIEEENETFKVFVDREAMDDY